MICCENPKEKNLFKECENKGSSCQKEEEGQWIFSIDLWDLDHEMFYEFQKRIVEKNIIIFMYVPFFRVYIIIIKLYIVIILVYTFFLRVYSIIVSIIYNYYFVYVFF